MNSDDSISHRRAAEAAEWLITLRNEEPTPEQVAKWLEWSQADPANMEAFERAESLSLSLVGLSRRRKEALLRRVMPAAAPRAARPHGRVLALALAAGIGVAAIGLALWSRADRQPLNVTYVTAKAENRSFELPDGSKMVLGAGTRVDVDYSERQRLIVLRDGEAFFDVAEQTGRPFLVRAGTMHLTDIGTRFDVRKSGEHVMVTVSEGIVDIHDESGGANPAALEQTAPLVHRPIRLRAGERATIAAPAVAPILTHVNAATASSWQRGRLDFQDEPLSVVIANVNRYATSEIVIVDPAVSGMRFTGTVFHDRVDDWLTGTAHLFDLQVERAADGSVLLRGSPPQH
jgi:transmembrane sensor